MIVPACIEVRLLPFQIHKILNHDILDWLKKPKIVRSCIFPIANLYFELIVDCVPKVIIPENCRLHNKLFACNDFCGQRATTIYCGLAYKF